jgi:hypothetical protein
LCILESSAKPVSAPQIPFQFAEVAHMYHDLSKIRELKPLSPGDAGYLGPTYDEP